MSVEEKLKDLIIERYHSVREFSRVTDIAYSTIQSMLTRGVTNTNVSTVIKVCQIFGISVDALADGEIATYNYARDPSTVNVTVEINKLKTRLSSAKHIIIDGKEIDIEFVEPIIETIDVGMKLSRHSINKKHNRNEDDNN